MLCEGGGGCDSGGHPTRPPPFPWAVAVTSHAAPPPPLAWQANMPFQMQTHLTATK